MKQLRDPKLTKNLRHILEEECALQKAYLEVMTEERRCLGRMQDEGANQKVLLLTTKREVLAEAMKQLSQQRAELLSVFPGTEGRRVSEIIAANFHKADVAELMPHVNRLKTLISKSRHSGLEFSQIVDFSLNLVNGLVSLLWSASQSVIKSYAPNGKPRESYNPGTSRAQSVLKQA